MFIQKTSLLNLKSDLFQSDTFTFPFLHLKFTDGLKINGIQRYTRQRTELSLLSGLINLKKKVKKGKYSHLLEKECYIRNC